MRKFLILGFLLCALPVRAAVAHDATITGSDVAFASSTSFSTTAMTVGASATCLAVGVSWSAAVTAVTIRWNSVAINAGPAKSQTGAMSEWFYVSSPATGNKTLSGAWTTSADGYVTAISWTGTDTSNCIKTSDNSTSTTTTITVTSSANDATAALITCTMQPCNATNFTAIFNDTSGTDNAGASYALGGTSNGHTFNANGLGGTDSGVGIHIVAPTGAGCTTLALGGITTQHAGCT